MNDTKTTLEPPPPKIGGSLKEHKCDKMPEYPPDIKYDINRWILTDLNGYNWIVITHCPFCGKKLLEPEPECEDGIYIMDSKIMGGKTVMRKTWNVWAQFGTEHHVPHKDLAKHGFRIIRKIDLNE